MSRSTTPLRRRLLAAVTAILFAVFGAGFLILSTAAPAAAASVTLTAPALAASPLDDASEPAQGTANAGDHITVAITGGPGTGCTARANSSGFWSCIVTGLDTNQFTTFTASRPGGGLGDSASRTYGVLLPPHVDGIVDGKIRGTSNQPTMTGTGDPGAGIKISVDFQLCSTTADITTGVWSCPDPTPVSGGDGDYFIVYNQLPVWNGSPSLNAAAQYELDTIALEPTFTKPVVAGGGPVDAEVTDSTPKFSGAAEPNAQVFVWWASGESQPPITPLCQGVANASGNWSCTPTTPLPVDLNSIGSYQVDDVGNTSPSPDPQINLTVLPPPSTPIIDAPASGATRLGPTVTISGSALGSLGGLVTIRENGATLCTSGVVGDARWQCSASLGAGTHTITATAKDTFGTVTAAASRTFTVILPAPAPTPTPTPTPTDFAWTLQVVDPTGLDVTGTPLAAGTTVTLQGAGVPAGYTATAELHSTPIALGSQPVNADGTFAIPAAIPANLEPGAHDFIVTLTSPNGPTSTRDTPVTVTAPPATKPTKPHNDAGVPVRAPASRAPGLNTPLDFTSSLGTLQTLDITPVTIAATGGAALIFLFFVAVPSELLESTVRSNYPLLFGWLAPLRRRFDRLKAKAKAVRVHPIVATTAIILVSSVILGFSSPSFGFNGASLRLFFAMFLSLAVINVGISAVVQLVARTKLAIQSSLDAMPATVLLVLASVLLSRALGVEPGFLFGVVLGINFAVELGTRRDALLALLGIGLSMVVGVAAWLGYSAIAGAHLAHPGFWILLVEEALTAITAEALATLVIGLLPLEFLDGKVIWKWSKWAWAGTYVVALLLFLVIILPMSNNWGQTSARFFGWGAVFLAFCLVTVGLWVGFQVRQRRQREH